MGYFPLLQTVVCSGLLGRAGQGILAKPIVLAWNLQGRCEWESVCETMLQPGSQEKASSGPPRFGKRPRDLQLGPSHRGRGVRKVLLKPGLLRVQDKDAWVPKVG